MVARGRAADDPQPRIDSDGACEVLCLLVDFDVERDSKWNLGQTRLALLDGGTGEIKRESAPEQLTRCSALVDGELQVANYVHQRFVIADLAGRGKARDFVIKVGDTVLAFGPDLDVLWTYTNPWNHYPKHAAYIPTVGDLDGDGRDEVIGGHFGLDGDGGVLWEEYLGDNMDSVVTARWRNSPDSLQAMLSAGGQVVDERGNRLLELGMDAVPHGQEIRVGCVAADAPSPQLVIRYDGHHPRLMVVDNEGRILSRFEVDESPNNTGLEIVSWADDGETDLIFSPAALYDGSGRKVVTFPDLPPPTGGKMGWYHCFVADVCGDEREEVILYDPYSDAVYVYTAPPLDEDAFAGYTHTSRQYNARLID